MFKVAKNCHFPFFGYSLIGGDTLVMLEQIKQLASQGESHLVEFKKSTAQLKSALETACAFLNADGGTILIGVTDNGEIVGQEISDKTKREIGNELVKITPVPSIEVYYEKLPGTSKYVIVFHAATDSTKRPYMYDGRAFLRSQSDTIPMPREYLQQLTLINAGQIDAWENQIIPNVTIDDLDRQEILSTVKEGSSNGRIPENYITDDPWKALQRLGLTRENEIINAAFVLFGKQPELILPQCIVRLARFKGTDKKEFIDNKQISGNIFKLLQSTMIFANTHLPIASTFPEGEFQRKDTLLFPMVVLREAIANALCHRDYSYYGGSVSFAIYDDRIEVWNYGLFPPGITIENLKKLNCSVPRNRKIANVLYYHKIFESWGRGIKMIIDECVKAGHPEPFYSQDGVGTLLTLPSKQSIGGGVIRPSKRKNHLTARQKEIIILFEKHKELSSDEVKNLLKEPLSDRWIRNELMQLKEARYLDYVGETRSRKWFLVK